MQTGSPVKDRRFALIEIPRTGCASVALLLNLKRPKGCEPFMRPDDARKVLSKKVWDRAEKITVVRNVEDRFRSACGAAGLAADEAIKMLESTPVEEWPLEFAPQSRWLTCRIDIILTTPTIARFANHGQFGRGVCPPGNSTAAPPLTIPQKEALRALYAEDLETFAKLRVWHEEPDVFMLLGGRCKSCEAKIAVRREETVSVGPSEVPEDPAPEETGEGAGQ